MRRFEKQCRNDGAPLRQQDVVNPARCTGIDDLEPDTGCPEGSAPLEMAHTRDAAPPPLTVTVAA